MVHAGLIQSDGGSFDCNEHPSETSKLDGEFRDYPIELSIKILCPEREDWLRERTVKTATLRRPKRGA
jgi:hypothetical protein